MKLAVLATVAALGVAAFAMPGQATVLGATQSGVTSHAIVQIGCVWRSSRVRVPRHVGPHGHVVPAHWVSHRRKVCR